MNRFTMRTAVAATACTAALALTVGCSSGGSGSGSTGRTGKTKGQSQQKSQQKSQEELGKMAGSNGKAGKPRYSATTWAAATIRKAPDNKSKSIGGVRKGVTVKNTCWVPGGVVEAEGTRNHVWLKTGKGWVTAIYFKGDKYGNLPPKARC